MATESEVDEYGEEWENDEAELEDEQSDALGLVHPLPSGQAVDPAAGPVAKTQGCDETTTKAAPRKTKSDSLDESHGESSCTDECASSSGCSVVLPSFPEEIVRLHARRARSQDERMKITGAPPPAPATMSVDSVSTIASAEAHRRIREYRRVQDEKNRRAKQEEAARTRESSEIRRMYKPFNRTIGVADVPPDQRYRAALQAKKMEKVKQESAAAGETASRWYRKVKRTSKNAHNAGDFGAKILEEAKRQHLAKLKAKEVHRQAIAKKLEVLSLEAKEIVSRSVGSYEPGSFILKTSHRRRSDKTTSLTDKHETNI